MTLTSGNGGDPQFQGGGSDGRLLAGRRWCVSRRPVGLGRSPAGEPEAEPAFPGHPRRSRWIRHRASPLTARCHAAVEAISARGAVYGELHRRSFRVARGHPRLGKRRTPRRGAARPAPRGGRRRRPRRQQTSPPPKGPCGVTARRRRGRSSPGRPSRRRARRGGANVAGVRRVPPRSGERSSRDQEPSSVTTSSPDPNRAACSILIVR
jgi:hypothetical protein